MKRFYEIEAPISDEERRIGTKKDPAQGGVLLKA
jgi:hypothetical protein